MKSLGLKEAENDRCVFFRLEPLVILAIYVDDGLLFAEDQRQTSDIIQKMKKEFDLHEVSVASYLGFQIEIPTRGQVFLHQSGYIQTILDRFDMGDCRHNECTM